MQSQQLTIEDEAVVTGSARWLLTEMIEPVLVINRLADQSERYWDASGMWAPRLADDAGAEAREVFELYRGRLDSLVKTYEHFVQRDWARDFEILTGYRVQSRGRFMTRPVRWYYSGIAFTPCWTIEQYEALAGR